MTARLVFEMKKQTVEFARGEDDDWPRRLVGALDGVAVVALIAIAVQVVAAIVAGASTVYVYPSSLGNGVVVHVPSQFWFDVGQGASWAGVAGGLLLLVSLGAVVVPRLALWSRLPTEQEARARRLLITILAAAVVVVASAALSIASSIMVDGFVRLYRGEVVITVAGAVGVALLAGVAGVLAWFSLAYWPACAADGGPRRRNGDENYDPANQNLG